MARFYGWTFDDLRKLSVYEYEAARSYLVDYHNRQRQGHK